jgi:hypothetical protein
MREVRILACWIEARDSPCHACSEFATMTMCRDKINKDPLCIPLFSVRLFSAMVMAPDVVEDFFAPSTSYRNLLHSRVPNHALNAGNVQEVQFISTLEELSSCEFLAWEAVHSLIASHVVWMTPTVFLRNYPATYDARIFPSMVCISQIYSGSKIYVFAEEAEQALRVVDCLLHLLSKSDKPDISLKSLCGPQMRPCSALALQHFVTRTRSKLRKMTFEGFMLEEGHCRALAHESFGTDPDMEIKLFQCSLTGEDGCSDAFIDWLHSSRGPSVLFRCVIECHVLADGLTGNGRLKKLVLARECLDGHLGCSVMAQALAANLGLVKLYVGRQTLNSENWNLLVHSLRAHPSLQVLDLSGTREGQSRQERSSVTPEKRRARRTSAIAQIVQSNTVLHTVQLSDTDLHKDIFDESIQPWLEMNQSWPRVMSIQGTIGPLRGKVLGRALYKVRHNPNRMWMILSGNGDVLANVQAGMI